MSKSYFYKKTENKYQKYLKKKEDRRKKELFEGVTYEKFLKSRLSKKILKRIKSNIKKAAVNGINQVSLPCINVYKLGYKHYNRLPLKIYQYVEKYFKDMGFDATITNAKDDQEYATLSIKIKENTNA